MNVPKTDPVRGLWEDFPGLPFFIGPETLSATGAICGAAEGPSLVNIAESTAIDLTRDLVIAQKAEPDITARSLGWNPEKH